MMLVLLIGLLHSSGVSAFGVAPPPRLLSPLPSLFGTSRIRFRTRHYASTKDAPFIRRAPEALEDIPIPFVDKTSNSFIECYADSIATVNGVEYTIGVPCDYAVALCYSESENDSHEDDEDEEEFIQVELDDPLMDDLFPVAKSIVEGEFGEDLVLERTPQTLTLVGELEDDDDDYDEDDEDYDEDDDGEEVDVLLSFDHKGVEYSLVRMKDPMFLVGLADPDSPSNRRLLSTDEADKVVPTLEKMLMTLDDYDDDE
jgi:Protein of unknown function (DUF3727)